MVDHGSTLSTSQLDSPPCFLLGFLLKVSTFGLIIDFVENEAVTAPTDWEIFKENIIQQTARTVVVVITSLNNFVVKYKDTTMLLQYGSNLSFIYALFLSKYLSIDCFLIILLKD